MSPRGKSGATGSASEARLWAELADELFCDRPAGVLAARFVRRLRAALDLPALGLAWRMEGEPQGQVVVSAAPGGRNLARRMARAIRRCGQPASVPLPGGGGIGGGLYFPPGARPPAARLDTPCRWLAERMRWHLRARRDALTGLPNRRALEEAADRAARLCARGGRPLAFLLADFDRLRDCNRRRGHPAGDRALCALARRLQGALRRSDTAGRWGGDEFLVILPDTGRTGARAAARRLLRGTGDGEAAFGFSLGLAFAEPAREDWRPLVQEAAGALGRAKRAGRNRFAAPTGRPESVPGPGRGRARPRRPGVRAAAACAP